MNENKRLCHGAESEPITHTGMLIFTCHRKISPNIIVETTFSPRKKKKKKSRCVKGPSPGWLLRLEGERASAAQKALIALGNQDLGVNLGVEDSDCLQPLPDALQLLLLLVTSPNGTTGWWLRRHLDLLGLFAKRKAYFVSQAHLILSLRLLSVKKISFCIEKGCSCRVFSCWSHADMPGRTSTAASPRSSSFFT